jgi:hypothetical protein
MLAGIGLGRDAGLAVDEQDRTVCITKWVRLKAYAPSRNQNWEVGLFS